MKRKYSEANYLFMDSKDTEYVSRDSKNPDYLPMDMVKAIAGNLILHQTTTKGN